MTTDLMRQIPALIALAPLLGAALLPLLAWKLPRLRVPTVFLVCAISTAAALAGLVHVMRHGPMMYYFGGWQQTLGIAWRLDGLSALMALAVSASFLVILIGTRTTITHEFEGRLTAAYSCLLLLAAGILGLTLSADLFNVFVFLEVSSLSAYALIGSGSTESSEAGFRYLLIGTAGASLYLIGVAFIYASTGSLNMADATQRLHGLWDVRPVIAGLGLMVAGLSLKSAIVPLHGWLPDAYADAPSSVSAFVAPLMTKVALYALLRIVGWVALDWWDADSSALRLLRMAAIAAVIFGPLAACAQRNFRRLLAYSSIGQIGLIALGISFASALGYIGALLHILNDILAKAVLFLTSCMVRRHMDLHKVSAIGRLRHVMPVQWTLMTLAGLSMVGIPPMLGFFSKWYLILAACEQQRWAIAALVVCSGLLSASYVFVLVEELFGEDAAETANAVTGKPARVSGRAAGLAAGRAAKRRPKPPKLRGPAFASAACASALIALGLWNQSVSLMLSNALPPSIHSPAPASTDKFVENTPATQPARLMPQDVPHEQAAGLDPKVMESPDQTAHSTQRATRGAS